MNQVHSNLNMKKLARLAGFFYLLIIIGGLYGGLVARGSLIDTSSAAATLSNIMGDLPLFRIGFLSDL